MHKGKKIGILSSAVPYTTNGNVKTSKQKRPCHLTGGTERVQRHSHGFLTKNRHNLNLIMKKGILQESKLNAEIRTDQKEKLCPPKKGDYGKVTIRRDSRSVPDP